MTYSLLGNHVDEKTGKTHRPHMMPASVNLDGNTHGFTSTVKICKQPGCNIYHTWDQHSRMVERQRKL